MAELSASQNITLDSVLDGSALSQIQRLRSDAAQYNQALIDSRLARKNPTLIARAEQSLLGMRNQLNAAVAAYNQISNYVQTATGQNVGMAGLGVEPATIALIAAIAGGIIAVGFLLDKLAMAIAAAQGKSIETRGYIDQLGFAIQSTGDTAVKFGTVVIVLGVAYLLYANRGSLGKLFSGLKSKFARG